MKRRVFLLSVLMALGFATFLTSCNKEKSKDRDDRDDKELSCRCEIYDEWWNEDYYEWEWDEYTETFDQDDLDDLRVDDCDELEELLYDGLYDEDGDEDEVNCRED